MWSHKSNLGVLHLGVWKINFCLILTAVIWVFCWSSQFLTNTRCGRKISCSKAWHYTVPLKKGIKLSRGVRGKTNRDILFHKNNTLVLVNCGRLKLTYIFHPYILRGTVTPEKPYLLTQNLILSSSLEIIPPPTQLTGKKKCHD